MMAPSGAAKKPFWGCRCGFDTNWACRPKCHKCGAGAPYKVLAKLAGADTAAGSATDAGRQPKPKAKAKAAAGGTPAPTAEAKLRQQLDAANRKHEQDLKKLKDELQELRKARDTGDAGAETAAAGMEVDGESELGKAVSLARDRLQKAKDMPSVVRDLMPGGYDACIAQLQADLAAAQATRRAANPLSKQLETAEAYKLRMVKKLDTAKSTLQASEAERAEIDKKVQAQLAEVAEAEATVARATAEVAALAAQYASEKSPAPSTGAVAGQPAAAPEGFVPLALAEAKWMEREQQFAAQIAALQTLVAGSTQDAAACAASDAASEAGDESLLALEEDEAWSKVDKGRRKAVLRRERDVLAKRVRTSLYKVREGAHCPFRKTAAS